MKATPTTETEIKLPAADAASARRLLYRAGFRVHKRRVFEDNRVFDTAALGLRKAGCLLRVREAGEEATLTYKGPTRDSGHKSREELEVTVSDARMMAALLAGLSFQPIFPYQKYRTEFQQRGGAGTATVDEAPIGVYLVLEGTPAGIDRTPRPLGVDK